LNLSSLSARAIFSAGRGDFSTGFSTGGAFTGDFSTRDGLSTEESFEAGDWFSFFVGEGFVEGGGVAVSLADLKDLSDREDSELSLDGPEG
jgi:hypothetical protein